MNGYYESINRIFDKIAGKYKIPKRVPPHLYRDILSENDLVVVILEHLDYLLKLKGKKSPFGYAAYSISKINEPLSSLKDLKTIRGVGKATEDLILEILETGTSEYYEKLLTG